MDAYVCLNLSMQEIEYEATEGKKPARGSTSAKRSRAAEVHNLSERVRNHASIGLYPFPASFVFLYINF